MGAGHSEGWRKPFSDSQETFHSCSDVVFDGGNGEVTGVKDRYVHHRDRAPAQRRDRQPERRLPLPGHRHQLGFWSG